MIAQASDMDDLGTPGDDDFAGQHEDFEDVVPLPTPGVVGPAPIDLTSRLVSRAEARARAEADGLVEPEIPAPEDWPARPATSVLRGPLGEIALALAPHTEADPIGILVSLQARFGVACGNGRSIWQGTRIRLNPFVILVGDTSLARKGTADGVAADALRLACPEIDGLQLKGLASGEALAGHLERSQAKDGETRVLILEQEIAALLVRLGREGSTISQILRSAADGEPLGYARARDEALIVDHHVGLLGHITREELRARVSDVDAANGFVNRIAFYAVRRSHLVPFPSHRQPWSGRS